VHLDNIKDAKVAAPHIAGILFDSDGSLLPKEPADRPAE